MGTKKVHHSMLLALPNTVWGIVVGLGGNAILWKTVATHRFTRKVLGRSGQWAFFGVSGILWIILSLLTVAKVVTNFEFCCREWRCGVRIYFFNMMNVSLFMYAIAVPATLEEAWRAARTAAFCVASLMQIGFNLEVYRRWLFSNDASLAGAVPQYMLSTVCWALGCLLAQELDLDRRWRIGVAELMIGCAVAFYFLAAISVIQGLAEKPHLKGEPVLFLFLAPPSVSATCFANFNSGKFQGVPVAVLGYCLMLFLVLLLSGPKLAGEPKILGAYWAYVFPVAALGSACVNYAAYEDSPATKAVAWVVFAIAETMLVAVFARAMYHHVRVMQGRTIWRDPLAPAYTLVDESAGRPCDDREAKSSEVTNPA